MFRRTENMGIHSGIVRPAGLPGPVFTPPSPFERSGAILVANSPERSSLDNQSRPCSEVIRAACQGSADEGGTRSKTTRTDGIAPRHDRRCLLARRGRRSRHRHLFGAGSGSGGPAGRFSCAAAHSRHGRCHAPRFRRHPGATPRTPGLTSPRRNAPPEESLAGLRSGHLWQRTPSSRTSCCLIDNLSIPLL
jgi:hypothetical protein